LTITFIVIAGITAVDGITTKAAGERLAVLVPDDEASVGLLDEPTAALSPETKEMLGIGV